ncbi:hypothetical protein GGI15_003477 [Coemansia interrupta]|uniref:Glutathione S-transferase n=1 Tax=Coemansia interrupta TaxID=1126814 RepID=A0A9W8HAM5_9FUNG|nr:hypothetical protein GGI15_003477 [Coemansia interrupta]
MSAATYPFAENTYTLYSYAGCPFAQRTLRALEVAKVPHEVVEIDLANKPSWYHLVNPQLKVPALRTPSGDILIESLVTSEYVAEEFPDSQLLPSSSVERAQLRLFVEIFSSQIIPNIYGTLRAATAEEQEKKKQALLQGIREVSRELERQWERSSGKGGPLWYGDRFSLAEVDTVSFVNQLVGPEHYRGFKVPDTDEFKAFHRWFNEASKRPEYKKFSQDSQTIINNVQKFVA